MFFTRERLTLTLFTRNYTRNFKDRIARKRLFHTLYHTCQYVAIDIIEIMQGETVCPRCGAARLKAWKDLTRDERIAAERLPGSAQYSPEERKKHHFCTRCWFEKTDSRATA
jgi:hypothetical protein